MPRSIFFFIFYLLASPWQPTFCPLAIRFEFLFIRTLRGWPVGTTGVSVPEEVVGLRLDLQFSASNLTGRFYLVLKHPKRRVSESPAASAQSGALLTERCQSNGKPLQYQRDTKKPQ